MIKHVKIGILLNIYGKLLTKKQNEIMNYYYNQDLSLSEIAEKQNTSRQAVGYIIKKGEIKLFDYEEKLGIMEKNKENDEQIQLILSQLSEINDSLSEKKVEKILAEVQKELQNIS